MTLIRKAKKKQKTFIWKTFELNSKKLNPDIKFSQPPWKENIEKAF